MKIISEAELNKHNNSENLWLVIDGKVYNLTDYQNDHPGSDTILHDVAGTDATDDFHDVGHSKDAIEKMKEFEIGLYNKQCNKKETKKNLNDSSLNNNNSCISITLLFGIVLFSYIIMNCSLI